MEFKFEIDQKFFSIFLNSFSCVGFILNFITIYILSRPKFLKESIFRYFLVSAFLEVIALIIIVMHSIPSYLDWDIPLIFCQIHEFLMYTFYDFYPWISVLDSIDRLLSFKYSGKFKFIKKYKYQVLAISFLFFFFQ